MTWKITIDFERVPTRAVHRFETIIEGLEKFAAVAQAGAELQQGESLQIKVLSIGYQLVS